jgi:hypothetical protein
MCAQKDEKLQIVAFSTNDDRQTPNDIINIFLGQQNHKILKKSKLAIAFSTQLKNKETRIMICSVLNLSKEYTGITDVNCYLLFIDLERSDSIDRLKNIINYARDNCRLTKKIFVLGMVSGNEDEEIKFTKDDVTQILDEFKARYEYKEINLSKIKEISDIMIGIFDYSSQHPIDEDEEIEKGDDPARSCILF